MNTGLLLGLVAFMLSIFCYFRTCEILREYKRLNDKRLNAEKDLLELKTLLAELDKIVIEEKKEDK